MPILRAGRTTIRGALSDAIKKESRDAHTSGCWHLLKPVVGLAQVLVVELVGGFIARGHNAVQAAIEAPVAHD